MEKKLYAKDYIKKVLLKDMYQTPEAITVEIESRYGYYCKCSSVERRLRELEDAKIVVNKLFQNEGNSSRHARWKLKTEEIIKPKPKLAVIAKEIGNLFARIIKKGEGHC